MPRLILVSNRLPVTVATKGDGVDVVASAGGLATGLRGHHDKSDSLWVGWPGETAGWDDAHKAALETKLDELRCVSVHLSSEEIERYYDGFSNAILWPLFHYLLDRVPMDSRDWEVYRTVNQRFADRVAEVAQPGDLVWVQDYQLCLVPGMLRAKVPELKIGFFLHIPFPSSEIFRTLPWRDEILRGIAGSDLVGFHTFGYQRHFASSLLRLLGVEVNVDRARLYGREVRLGVFPMGIDARAFDETARSDETKKRRDDVRAPREGAGAAPRMLLGVDRLDYTKGLPRRLLSFERLLASSPELHGQVRLVQVAVPSRMHVDAYARYRKDVEELVGRINGTYGTVSWTPVQYIFRGLAQEELIALYRAADVMVVTPLRDGMNLVAKEFVAARPDEDGVLVLSELAGAAAELGEALLVNPYDVDGVAQAMKTALDMSVEERRHRMQGLRRRVFAYDVHRWAAAFVDSLTQTPPAVTSDSKAAPGERELIRDLASVQRERPGQPLVLLLDYDGTLVPFARAPELARPDPDLIALLSRLAARPSTQVHVVSGRPRGSLEEWLGALPIGLHAEHGFWSRLGPDRPWQAMGDENPEWKAQARAVLDAFVARTPGSRVEEKTASLAWHYRAADPEFGGIQAQELRLHLSNTFSNAPVEVLAGDKVVEVRPYGINKGVSVKLVLDASAPDALVFAIGDDRTDEDMFAALPTEPGRGLTVHVGPHASRATYRLLTWQSARAVLRSLQ
jgi:trehalose 6-phosphate synthase/phosphatase